MALLSAAKRLFIPNKNQTEVKQPEYGNDMRAIEIFNPINILTAGTGVTLNPADGSGPTVEISASSSGGATGVWNLSAGPDIRSFSTPSPFGIPFSGLSQSPTRQNLFSEILTPTETGAIMYPYTTSWLWNILAGQSASVLPIIDAPAFSGGPCTVNFSIYALAFDDLDQAIYQTNDINITSGGSITTTVGDFTIVTTAPLGDLTLTAGAAFENGLISTAGDVYFGACQVNIYVPAGVVFT